MLKPEEASTADLIAALDLPGSSSFASGLVHPPATTANPKSTSSTTEQAAGLASAASDPEESQNRLDFQSLKILMMLHLRSKVVGLNVPAKRLGDVLAFI